jgi:hypothetical protein
MHAAGGGASGGPDGPLVVSSLLGSAHVAMALVCLGSLLRCSARPLRLRLHDDGSLTAADRERLAAGLGDPEVVARREADERVAGLLAGRPAARAFRDTNPLGLKLLDVALLAPGEDLAYCDSDVLFLRPFRGLFELPPGSGALCMADPQNAYSVRSWHLLREPRLRLAAHLNSGIIGFRLQHLDLDLIEWFLARPAHRFAPVWVEQTCWALLAQPAGCRLLDPAAIAIPAPGNEDADRQRVALHFVSPVRRLFGRHAAAAMAAARLAEAGGGAAGAGAPPVALRSIAARRLSAPAMAITEVRRRLRRLALRRGAGGTCPGDPSGSGGGPAPG